VSKWLLRSGHRSRQSGSTDGRSSTSTSRAIEIRLTSKLINSLDDDRVLRRARTSDWVMVDESERDLILDLASQAATANAAPAR